MTASLVSLLPLLLVLGLLASGRASALVTGLAGLAATAAAAVALVLPERGPAALAPLFARETAAGTWLAWHVIAIIASGMFFHRCLQARAAALRRRTDDAGAHATPRRLWAVCS